MNQQTFDGLGIAPKILEILDRLQFKVPTPIQAQSIAPALSGKDIMGIAQTGTGKTLAFGIPLIQRLESVRGKGLILLPTRELAMQVNDALNQLCQPLKIRTAVLIGGESMGKQINQLRNNPQIIICTPGRLIDHLEHRTADLRQTSILILDEADRMLDMGFAPQIKQILKTVPANRQTMLFSATMPPEITSIAQNYMRLPVRVEVAPAGSATANVTQELFFVHREQKMALLEKVLKEYQGSVLIFCRTKFGAKKLAATLRQIGHTAAEIHSNRSLSQRIEALSGFKLGRYRVLAATDIAARGIDVTGIELVINYDLPEQASDYVHRIGRTGRASHTGHAISFATPEQKFDVRAIEQLIKKQLIISRTPELPRSQMNHAQPAQFSDRDERPRNRPFNYARRPQGQRRGQHTQMPNNQPRRQAPQSNFNRFTGEGKPSPRYEGHKPAHPARPDSHEPRQGGFNRFSENRPGQKPFRQNSREPRPGGFNKFAGPSRFAPRRKNAKSAFHSAGPRRQHQSRRPDYL